MEKLEPSNLLTSKIVKIEESRLDLSYFFLHFHFSFLIYFLFLFLEQLGLGLIGHAVNYLMA